MKDIKLLSCVDRKTVTMVHESLTVQDCSMLIKSVTSSNGIWKRFSLRKPAMVDGYFGISRCSHSVVFRAISIPLKSLKLL